MKRKGKWREIAAIAAPVVVSKLSFTAMGLVDTAMVGRLGASQQGAVGIATTFMFTVYVFGLGLIGVVNTFVSQYHGSNKPSMCGVSLGHGIRLAVGLGTVTYLILVLSEPLFAMAGLSEEVCRYGYGYMFFRIIGLPGVFLYWAYNGYLEGLGETRVPMYISLAANVVNIALDYTLIFGAGPIPALGVEGAGMATAGSNLFMLVCFAVVVHRKGGRFTRFGSARIGARIRWALMARMIRVGFPMGVQFFLEIGAFLLFSVMVGWVGDEALAAHQVALRLLSVSFMAAWGISVAATTLVGRHQGEGRSDLAMAAGLRTVIISVGYTLVTGAVLVSVPALLAGLFTPFEDVAATAATLLYVAAALQIFDGVSIVSYGALKGAGDTRWPMFAAVVINWTLGVPLVYFLTIAVGMGVLGAWLGMGAMLTIQGLAMFWRFKAGRWSQTLLVSAPSLPGGAGRPRAAE